MFPSSEGERCKYAAYIEMNGSYLSGICVLLKEDGIIKGCLFNEFGVTALDFTYQPERKKVKLHHVIQMMDKWYIRRVLRKDMAQVMAGLQNGRSDYKNERRKITYQFTPITDETNQ
jgi:hypothetical protein